MDEEQAVIRGVLEEAQGRGVLVDQLQRDLDAALAEVEVHGQLHTEHTRSAFRSCWVPATLLTTYPWQARSSDWRFERYELAADTRSQFLTFAVLDHVAAAALPEGACVFAELRRSGRSTLQLSGLSWTRRTGSWPRSGGLLTVKQRCILP